MILNLTLEADQQKKVNEYYKGDGKPWRCAFCRLTTDGAGYMIAQAGSHMAKHPGRFSIAKLCRVCGEEISAVMRKRQDIGDMKP